MGCFGGGGGAETQTINSTTRTEIPAWIEREGERLFETAKPVTEQDYPGYSSEQRVEPFSPDTVASQGMARGNVGSWIPSFASAYAGAATGGSPVEGDDISRYMNPFTQEVLAPLRAGYEQEEGRQRVKRHGDWAKRGSYLNEDRRDTIDAFNRTRMEEAYQRAAAPIKYQAFKDAYSQAGADKTRALSAGNLFGQLAPQVQQLGFGDVASLQGIGMQQETRGQRARDIDYEEFLKSFYYPQEQMNWLQGFLSQTPYSKMTTGANQQLIPQPNQFAQTVGSLTSIAGMGMSLAGLFSSATMKEEIAPPEHILPRLDMLKIHSWRYREGHGTDRLPHIGPIAEQFHALFGVGHKMMIHPIDGIGICLLGLQELSRKVDRLEAAHG